MAVLNLESVADLDRKPERTVTDKINYPATPPSRVVYSIICAFPGQVAFCIPQITEDPKYVERLVALLANEPLVIDRQVDNTMVGSIAITYKSDTVLDVDMRSHLANLIQLAGNPEVVSASTKEFQPYSDAVTTEDRQDRKPTREAEKQESATFSLSSIDASASKTKSNSVSSAHSVIQQPKKPVKVAYSIAHAIPGRVRFRVPRIASDPKYVQRLETLLKSDSTVTSERVNSAARSVVITYKTEMMRNSQKRVQSFLSAAISHLASLIESANDPATAIS
ncbi:hypothetical protein GNF10_24510 [Nostoc sp. UCD121]|uniref:HMA2 domain-containing protein n=1 Tax=unclassified Nostoc TaxID=2593658 RepID=UPI001626A2D3|nr:MULTISPECIES: hypothetical protein [unclassified Nostoc]MBC1221575.1 hypothetical protein [Nostoc sp. UCD120]MBC1279040.1 hypothetical protein [Nostoc sp. UCD121]MBC1297442.1 hypothetical protein [Nostoc sp. UCD122]